MSYIDLANDMQNHNVQFILYPYAWSKFHWPAGLLRRNRNWIEVKYVAKNGRLNNDVNLITNQKGGIYLFIVKSPILPSVSEYLVYIGRAQKTRNHNLRIRVKKYLNEYLKDNSRPKVVKMVTTWKDHLYLRYIVMDNNNDIQILEKRLINSILPPFNYEIPDKTLRRARKAF